MSRNSIEASVVDLQSVADSIGMRFRAAFLRFGTARIRNGRVQIDAGVSGRLGNKQQEHMMKSTRIEFQ